ncbi:MAG: peptidylprolyl isomerase [Candidatus Omnitrophota bacterium]
MKKWFLLSYCLLLAGCAGQTSVATTSSQSASRTGSTTAVPGTQTVAPVPTSVTSTPTPETAKDDTIVKIKIETTMGDIYADLYQAEAPKTVENFVTLTKKGFYDGIIFHRVIPGFMIQTGDPTGTGMGGPGYQFADEFSKKLRHDKPGVLAMANSGPNTNGSQFFITEVPTPWLDDRHSVFGQVTGGMDVVLAIAQVPRDRQDKPVQKIAMNKVVVLSK